MSADVDLLVGYVGVTKGNKQFPAKPVTTLA